MMTKLLFPLFFIAIAFSSMSQDTRGLTIKRAAGDSIHNNFALVVGISSYANIPRLNYADDDALAFAEYLINNQVCKRKDVIKLIDSAATTGNFYKELKKLLGRAQKNDRVFIYFAGHGDVENDIESGFLLTYNTEATNYSAGAIDIDMLQKHVNAFINKNVKVVLITDACRAGNLAGGMAGASTTIGSLSKGFQNVVKVLSCQPDQLSEEKLYPGGGHGVFTYHLLNGLNGLADREDKGFVSVRDLDIYLDEVTIETGKRQTPMVNGDKQLQLTSYDTNLKQAAIARKNATGSQPVASVKKRSSADTTWSSNTFFQSFNDYVRKNQLIQPDKANSYYVLQQAIHEGQPSELVEELKLELAAILEDEAQKWINKYIRGEIGTNESLIQNELQLSLNYIDVVEQLIGKDDIRYNDIHAKKVFFTAYACFLLKDRSMYATNINRLEEVMAAMPGQPWLLRAQALLYGELEQYEKAIEKNREALRFAPQWKFVLNGMAINLHEIDRPKEALSWVKKVIQVDSNYIHGWHQMGAIYNTLRYYDSAITCLQKAIELDPFYNRPLRNLAESYTKLGKYELAEQTYYKAMALNPGDPSSANDLGLFYIDQDRLNDAEMTFRKGVQTHPHYHYNWRNLSEVYKLLENDSLAEATLRESVSVNPTEADLWNSLGLFYEKRDKRPESIAAYRKANEVDSFYSYAFNNMAQAMEEMYEFDSAIVYHKKWIVLRPRDAASNIRRVRSIYDYNLRNMEGFIDFCHWLNRIDTANIDYRKELANALFNANRFAEAEKVYYSAYALKAEKELLHKIIECRTYSDTAADEQKIFASVFDLQHYPEAVLVEIGLYKRSIYTYSEKSISNWKGKKESKKISNYLRYLVAFDEKAAESWVDLAKEYMQYELPKDSIQRFLRTAIRLDSTAAQFDAWPLLCSTLNDAVFTSKSIRYLEGQRKHKESYLMLYNLARCYYLGNKYPQALATLKYARINYDIVRQSRDDFEKISDEDWQKSFDYHN